jgi:hypothetical protein
VGQREWCTAQSIHRRVQNGQREKERGEYYSWRQDLVVAVHREWLCREEVTGLGRRGLVEDHLRCDVLFAAVPFGCVRSDIRHHSVHDSGLLVRLFDEVMPYVLAPVQDLGHVRQRFVLLQPSLRNDNTHRARANTTWAGEQHPTTRGLVCMRGEYRVVESDPQLSTAGCLLLLLERTINHVATLEVHDG